MNVNEGIMYFDRKNNTFCQLRKLTEKGANCSYADYYMDAQTTIGEVPYSAEYINENFVLVEDVGLDKVAEFNGVGWKVKERFKVKG